jgi:hypothetical protein
MDRLYYNDTKLFKSVMSLSIMEEISCDSCGDKIEGGDEYLRVSEMRRQSDGEIESRPAEYVVCRKETCLCNISL